MKSGPKPTRASGGLAAISALAVLTFAGPAPAQEGGGLFGLDTPQPAGDPAPAIFEDLPADHPCAGLDPDACAEEAAALAGRAAELDANLQEAEARAAASQAVADRAGESLAALRAELAAAVPELPEGHVCAGMDPAGCADLAATSGLAIELLTERAKALEAGLAEAEAEAAAARAAAASASEDLAALRAELSAAELPALAAGHPCVDLAAADCADIAAVLDGRVAELEAKAEALEDAARSIPDLPEDHPCAGLAVSECADLAGGAADRIAALEARVDELEPLARYRRLFLDANTEIDRLTLELEACNAAPDCSADPALLEAQAALTAAEEEIAALEGDLTAALTDAGAAGSEMTGLTDRIAELEASLARMEGARDNALIEFSAAEAERDGALTELATVTGQLEGLRTAMAALERENQRLAEELRAQRDLPRIQAALGDLPCGEGSTVIAEGGTVPVIARSAEEAARIGAMLEGLGGGVRFEIGIAGTIPGAGCPAVVAPGWVAVRWEGEPPEVTGSIVGAADAGSQIGALPDARLCRELAGALVGEAARFWVRRDGELALCDVGDGEIDDTRNPRGASAVLLLPLETVATVGGG